MTTPPAPLTDDQIVTRLLAAAAAGGLLGFNRELKHKPAGLRTHAMVALGAAAMVLAAGESTGFRPDALSRVIQGVLTGIGFLGAGTILRGDQSGQVHGLTTAATIWVVACVGVACGVGRWRIAVVVVSISWLVLVGGQVVRSMMGWGLGRIKAGRSDASPGPRP